MEWRLQLTTCSYSFSNFSVPSHTCTYRIVVVVSGLAPPTLRGSSSLRGGGLFPPRSQLLRYPLVVGPGGQNNESLWMQVKVHINISAEDMYIMWCSKNNMQHLLMQALTSIDSHITKTEHIMMVILAILNPRQYQSSSNSTIILHK